MTATFANPGQELDYKRFTSEAFLDELLAEKQVLKGARPDIPLTTNFMGFLKALDYFAWADGTRPRSPPTTIRTRPTRMPR